MVYMSTTVVDYWAFISECVTLCCNPMYVHACLPQDYKCYAVQEESYLLYALFAPDTASPVLR